eukprot:gene19034-biopygen11239
MGIRQLPEVWTHVVSASDGGLFQQKATVGAVLLRRLADGSYPEDGPAVCEIAGRLLGPEQEVFLAESEAVERVCHAAPPHATVDIWMDALGRKRIIERFPRMSDRSRLKIAGRSSLRRIEQLVADKGLQTKFSWVKAHQDDTVSLTDLSPDALLNVWADALTNEARAYPMPESRFKIRAGHDPITIRLGDGTMVEGPVWDALVAWSDSTNAEALHSKRAKRRGTDDDWDLSGNIFMKSRVGMAIFSHMEWQVDQTLFAVRNHELWKANSSACFMCQGCHKPIHDHHFAFGSCHPKLPKWSDLCLKLNAVAAQHGIPEIIQWWRYPCRDPVNSDKGCLLHERLGDFTCLNSAFAEVPKAVAAWISRQDNTCGKARKAPALTPIDVFRAPTLPARRRRATNRPPRLMVMVLWSRGAPRRRRIRWMPTRPRRAPRRGVRRRRRGASRGSARSHRLCSRKRRRRTGARGCRATRRLAALRATPSTRCWEGAISASRAVIAGGRRLVRLVIILSHPSALAAHRAVVDGGVAAAIKSGSETRNCSARAG